MHDSISSSPESIPSRFWNPRTGTLFNEPIFTDEGFIEERVEYQRRVPDGRFDRLETLQQEIRRYAAIHPELRVYQNPEEWEIAIEKYVKTNCPWNVLANVTHFPTQIFGVEGWTKALFQCEKKDLSSALRWIFINTPWEEASVDEKGRFVKYLIRTFPEEKDAKYWFKLLAELRFSYLTAKVFRTLLCTPGWDFVFKNLYDQWSPDIPIYGQDEGIRTEFFWEILPDFFETEGEEARAFCESYLDVPKGDFGRVVDYWVNFCIDPCKWYFKHCPPNWMLKFRDHTQFWNRMLGDLSDKRVLKIAAMMTRMADNNLERAKKVLRDCKPMFTPVPIIQSLWDLIVHM